MATRLRVLASIGTCLLLAGAGLQAGAATQFPTVGGSGDASATDRCPPGMYLIGLKGRTGLWVDQVQIVCAPVTKAVYGSGWVPQVVSGGDGPKWYGPLRGGSGGGPNDQECPNGAVVSGASMTLTPGSRQVLLAFLECMRVGGSITTPAEYGGARKGPGFVSLGEYNCPPGEVAKGFQIRYGKDVNAMGLICDRL